MFLPAMDRGAERLPNLWPRVFWECAGHDRNLHSGGSKVAFVSLDSSGPVSASLCFYPLFPPPRGPPPQQSLLW
ncbi:hypothetical protein PO909_000929 [Leuciscus waleckii]